MDGVPLDVIDLGVAALAIYVLLVWMRQRGKLDELRESTAKRQEETEAQLVETTTELAVNSQASSGQLARIVDRLDRIEFCLRMEEKRMDMQQLLPVLGTVILIAWMIVRNLTQKYEAENVRAFVERHGPDALKEVQLWAAERAWEALEQMGAAYGHMSDAERKKKAEKLAQKLIDLMLRGKITRHAAGGLVESVIFNKKRGG